MKKSIRKFIFSNITTASLAGYIGGALSLILGVVCMLTKNDALLIGVIVASALTVIGTVVLSLGASKKINDAVSVPVEQISKGDDVTEDEETPVELSEAVMVFNASNAGKKEASEYQTEHLSTTGPVDSENLHMTEILERAISVGNSISQSSVNVNIGMNESTETVYNIGKIIETTFPQGSSKAQSTKGAAGTNVVSTSNYTQKNGNVNSEFERSSRDLSDEDVRLQVIMLK